MRQVAVVGMGRSEFHAPWFDSPEWEVWALPWHSYAYHAQRLFELHPLEIVLESSANRGGDAYWEKLVELSDMEIPLYMQKHHEGLDSSMAYPLADVVETIGRDYFGSSPAYPIALAISEGVDRIGLWGVDLLEGDRDHQRHNIEWLLGVAEGRGIEVQVHEDSKLFTLEAANHIGDIQVTYPTRYGWLT